MTMRVTIENADDSGRVIEVQQEDRPSDRESWQRSDRATLAKGEKRSWYIHAARRLVITENVR